MRALLLLSVAFGFEPQLFHNFTVQYLKSEEEEEEEEETSSFPELSV